MARRRRAAPFLALCYLGLMLLAQQVSCAARVPAIFVFGDSTVDVGNNNYLPNCSPKARANYPPYGVDFPNATPTGRFSNGLNTADYLARHLGFPMSPPPYLSLRTNQSIASQMLTGVNFASGGSGLLDGTGQIYTEVISASAQLDHFSSAVDLLRAAHGADATAEHLARSLFFVSVGSNDMFEYSYTPPFNSSDGAEFLAGLVGTYRSNLLALYGLGARKFSVATPPPLGCCPSQRARTGPGGGCLGPLNALARRFHEMVDAMLRGLPEGARYSLVDAGAVVSFVVGDPWLFGIKETVRACCGGGKSGDSRCRPGAHVCGDRAGYLFWDLYHPTEAMARTAAEFLYEGFPPYVYPVNVQELSAM